MTIYEVVTNRAKTAERPADIHAWAEANGHKITGLEDAAHLRPELHGQPKIEGFAGPMLDRTPEGEVVIRYEDWPSHDILGR